MTTEVKCLDYKIDSKGLHFPVSHDITRWNGVIDCSSFPAYKQNFEKCFCFNNFRVIFHGLLLHKVTQEKQTVKPHLASSRSCRLHSGRVMWKCPLNRLSTHGKECFVQQACLYWSHKMEFYSASSSFSNSRQVCDEFKWPFIFYPVPFGVWVSTFAWDSIILFPF